MKCHKKINYFDLAIVSHILCMNTLETRFVFFGTVLSDGSNINLNNPSYLTHVDYLCLVPVTVGHRKVYLACRATYGPI